MNSETCEEAKKSGWFMFKKRKKNFKEDADTLLNIADNGVLKIQRLR